MLTLLFVGGYLGLHAQNYAPAYGTTTTINVPSSGYTSVSDDGGPGGSGGQCNYTGSASNNYYDCTCITVVTICPDVPGLPVTLSFTEFGFNTPYDSLTVYNGPAAVGPVLYSNTNGGPQAGDNCIGPGTVVSTHPSGCITVLMRSSGTVNDIGYLAGISVPTLDYNLNLYSLNPPRVFTPGVQNVEVTVQNQGDMTIDSFRVGWMVNSVPQTPVDYTTPLASSGVTPPIVLSSTFNPSSGDNLTVWTSILGPNTDEYTGNDTISRGLCQAMVGTFTIDANSPASNSNFTSFQDAVDSMVYCGIAGPVTFNVVSGSGPYNEQVIIPEIDGASSTNRITFNGNGDTLEYTPISTAKFVLKLDGADWVTFDSLYVRGLDFGYGIGVLLSNNADHNTFRNMTVNMSTVTSTDTENSACFALAGNDTDPNTDGATGNFNLFENNTTIGGYYCFQVNGQTGGEVKGNVIRNNTCRDFYGLGIIVDSGDSTVIDNNEVMRPDVVTSANTFYGIYVDVSFGTVVSNNRIHDTHNHASSTSHTAYCIYTTASDATPGNENIFFNNLIYNVNNTSAQYGIYNSSSNGALYYHNTVSLDDAGYTGSGLARAFYQTSAATDIVIKNNIFSITRGGTGTNVGLYFLTTTSVIESDNNVIYINGAGTNYVGDASSADATLAAWQADYGQDMNSVVYNPMFANPGAGNFTPTGGGINNLGANVGIANDINGAPRNITAPDPGAFEFAGPLNDVGVTMFNNPAPITTATLQNIDVTIRNFGSNVVDSVRIVVALNGTAIDSVMYTTPLAVAADAGPITVGQFTPNSGDVLTVWTTLPNNSADAFPANDSATLNVCVGMAGNYTIDAGSPASGTNFTTFQNAIDSMASCGIAGAVRFDVVAGSGPYVEQPIIPQITGASSINTIAFVGHGDTIRFSPPSGAKYVFALDGADWVRLDSLIIQGMGTTYGIGILLNNNADNNIISNCKVDVSAVTSTTSTNSAAFAFTNSFTSPSSTGSGGRLNVVAGNEFVGGYTGVSVFGSSTGEADSNRIENNIIRDFYSQGFDLDDVVGTYIHGNDISRGNRSSVGSFYGVYFNSGSEGNLIDGNRIHNTHGSASSLTGSVYIFYASSADAADTLPNIIQNNLVHDINHDGTIYTFYASGSDNYYYLHNTISLDYQGTSTTSTTYGLYGTSSSDSIAMFNNIISMKRGGTGKKVMIDMVTSTVLGADGNVYFFDPAGGGLKYYADWDATYDTLANWQASNGMAYDQNSSDKNPRFNDPANGDYMPTSPLINDMGVNVGVAMDFFGNARPALTPDPGAIEFVPPPDDAGVVALINPVAPLAPGAYDVTVVFRNFGGFPISDVNIYATIDDGTTTTPFGPIAYTGNVGIGGTDTVLITNFNFNTSSSYTITAWTDQPNGVTDANTVNDTLVTFLCNALPAGSYTIDDRVATGGSNYNSFADVAAALDCGVLGDVTFTVQYGSGPYNEQFTLPVVPGAGPLATITIDGQDADSSVLTHNGTVQYATVLLNGTDYFTIKNMTIEATGVGGFGVQLRDNAEYNNVLNCVVDVRGTTAGATGIVASASLTSNSTDGFNTSHLWVDGNTIYASDYGIRLEALTDNYSVGNRITNNTIIDAIDAAIYTDDMDSIIYIGNTITTNSGNSDGIYNLDIQGYFEVIDNHVYVSDYGMYLEDANQLPGASVRRCKVINNIFKSTGDYGIYFNDADSIDVYYNTLVGAPGIKINLGENMDVRNNIFGGDGDFAFEEDDNANFVAIDYNIYFTTSTNVARFGSTSNDYVTIFDWRTAYPAYNANSYQGVPQFVDFDNDLHILSGLLAYDKGDPTVGITNDIDGDARPLAPSTGVDIGADEYTPFSIEMSVEEVLAPSGRFCGTLTDMVTVTLYNGGLQSQSNIPVIVELSGAVTDTISAVYPGPLAPDDRVTFDVGTFDGTAGGTVTITAYTMVTGEEYPSNDTTIVTVTIDSLPTPPVAVNDTACVGQSLMLGVAPNSFEEIEWYDTPTGGNLLGVGNTFSTGPLFATDTFYAAGLNGISEHTGRMSPTLGAGTTTAAGPGWGINFEVYDDIVIDSVLMFPTNAACTIVINIYDLNNGNALVSSTPSIAIPAGGNPIRVPVGLLVSPGYYNISMDITGTTAFGREISSSLVYPIVAPSGKMSMITGAQGFGSPTAVVYYFFYDWTISTPGCPSDRTPVEAVISMPVSNAGVDDTICAGEAATLTAGNGAGWSWSTGDTTQTINPSPASNNTYSLTITDAYGCTGTPDFVAVTVNTLPTANAGVDDTVCTGSTADLTATGGVGYNWSSGGLTSTTTVTVTSETTYTVTVTDANGCADTDEVTISVNPLPTGNAPADVDVCAGEAATLSATGGVSYDWSTGAGTATITVGPASTTTYMLTTTDANGCTGVDSVTVNVNALPTVSITPVDTACISDNPITLFGTPIGGTFSGVGVMSGQFVPGNVGLGTYNITYTYSDGNGCSNTATETVVVDSFNCFNAVANVAFAENITVYPNPFSGELNIDLTSVTTGVLEISMIDLLGQQVMTEELDMTVGINRYDLDMDSRLADGLYVVQLKHNDEVYQIRLIKSGN